MRHRAWLQVKRAPVDPDDQFDDRGHAVFTWGNVHDERVPFSVEQLFAGELERARQLQAGASHRVLMRYLPGVTRDMRFLMDDRAFYIGGIENIDESNRFLVLICEEQIL